MPDSVLDKGVASTINTEKCKEKTTDTRKGG